MKELTKWDNNPRMLHVWDEDFSMNVIRKVIYVAEVE